MNLQEIINKMKIPANRRDINKLENLLWLSRNLPIENHEHPDFPAAYAEIKQIIMKSLRLINRDLKS